MFFLGMLFIGLARIGRPMLVKNENNKSIQNDSKHTVPNIPKVQSFDENFISFQMMSDRRSYVDRRSGKDRRNLASIHCLPYAGKEKRTTNRRLQIERRKILVMTNKWPIIYPNDFRTENYSHL